MKCYTLNRKEQVWGLMKTNVGLWSKFRWAFGGFMPGPRVGFDITVMQECVRTGNHVPNEEMNAKMQKLRDQLEFISNCLHECYEA